MTNGFPRLRSRLLSQFPNVTFAMSTRQGAVNAPFGFNMGRNTGDQETRVEEHLARFLETVDLSPDEVAFMEQVHEEHIAEASEPGIYPGTDAIVTRIPRLALAIRTADCVPVMVYSPADNLLAAVHAGWRGCAGHITANTIRHLVDEYGAEPEYLFAYLGPSAKMCCYEIGEEIAGLFPESAVHRHNGAVKIDLQLLNRMQLLESGLKEENIEVESTCTICNPLYHSHRRDGAKSGRMLAVAYMNEGTS